MYADDSDFDWWVNPELSRKSFSTTRFKFMKNETISEILSCESSNSTSTREKLLGLTKRLLNLVKSEEFLTEDNNIFILKILSKLSTENSGIQVVENEEVLSWIQKKSESNSPGVFLESWKIIQNLSNVGRNVYLEGIYPLVPPWIKTENPVVDVVLVHGIKGGAARTWRQRDSEKNKPVLEHSLRQVLMDDIQQDSNRDTDLDNHYSWIWPLDWLGRGVGVPLRILAVDYSASWGGWSVGSEQEKSLDELSSEIRANLKAAGVGSRPIVWLTHSMGGLIVKKLLQSEEGSCETGEDRRNSISGSTRGLVFLSVPHFGSPLASWASNWESIIRPSQFVQLMAAGCPNLASLHDFFVAYCEKNSVLVLTLNESKPSQITRSQGGPRVLFVPVAYGDPKIGEFHKVDVSHMDICKPKGRFDEIYVYIENFVKSVIEKPS